METQAERRVWELLTRDFYWELPADFAVKLYGGADGPEGETRLQLFEVAVAAIFARLRPEYEWYVTPNRPDGGLDFVGRHGFLEDEALGIAAAITVGGQCKKRTRVDDIVGEVAGSLARMASTINPTFFVVALSARLNRDRVEDAREILERTHHRHCHILDREQIEGLIHEHLTGVDRILRRGLADNEVDEVLEYFESNKGPRPSVTLNVAAPERVLGGVPFSVRLTVRSLTVGAPGSRLWWRPSSGVDLEPGLVTLIGPLGADGPGGAALVSAGPGSDPLVASCAIEFVTYAVGTVDLGEILIGIDETGIDSTERIALGCVDAIETMRPRFFDRPYREGLERLASVYERVLAGAVESVGVVGAGGSGKSRMCEEFALEKRRRGSSVITARHAKTHEEPQRILGELLTGLVADGRFGGDLADEVIQELERYDSALAAKAAPAIRSTFGMNGSASGGATEQGIVSALVLLIVARSRQAPLIIHLQDLHWCSAEVLTLLERLQRQLSHLRDDSGKARHGVLFIFEGRVHESGDTSEEDWSSAPFEAFLACADSTMITCSSFTPEDGLTFTRRLFEGRHNAHRLLADDLLGLQEELASQICETAGGNPFHTLEQVRLLKEMGVIGQNPKTGLLYIIQPQPRGSMLPESVFAAIRLRWQYMRDRLPDLALLVWGSTLLDDQLPAPLFRRLWSELAPNVSLRDIDGTDMLWTGDGTAHEVVFRHENYFESIRRFTVSEADRRRVIEAYCSWFTDLQDPSPPEQFGWARTILELPNPDLTRAKTLLVAALNNSQRSGDPRLARRILAFYLDLVWDMDERSPIETPEFARHCDEESNLCRDHLGVDRVQAAQRIERMRQRIESHLKAFGDKISAGSRDGLVRRLLTAEALQAQLLFNDRRPTEAADIARRVVASVRAHRLRSYDDGDWAPLEMEALYTQSCAHAISGEFGSAVQSSADAAEIADAYESSLARKVVSTYGSMLLSKDPEQGESVLRGCLAQWADDGTSDAALVHVHLSMALVLQAHRCPSGSSKGRELLIEARDRMTSVHDSCRRLGLYADAGAAALVRGIVSGVSGEDDDAAWFAQGVAAAAKGGQMETLWRSHINLAMALFRKEREVGPTARDHALAAHSIMEDTLTEYSQPELSPRFEVLRVGMAATVWMLLTTGDAKGRTILERYPALRSHFSDPEIGVLAPYDGGPRHYQWLRVDDIDYVLY